VIVLRKFNKNIFWGVPLTSSLRKGPYYYQFSFTWRMSTALLSQMRLFDQKRLFRRIGFVSRDDFDELKKRAIRLLY